MTGASYLVRAENLFASYAQDPNLRVAGVSGPTSRDVRDAGASAAMSTHLTH